MSRLVVALMAILGLCSASPASEEACQNFLKDSKFDSTTLDGIWTVVYYWPVNTVGEKVLYRYQALSAEQVTAYKNELSSTYPAMSWEKVKYSISMPDVETLKEVCFLLAIEDTGYATVIPTGELLKHITRLGEKAAKVNYAYKQVGEYVLAVKWCEDLRQSGYMMQKGTEHKAADIERAASGIPSAMSTNQGGVAAFLKH